MAPERRPPAVLVCGGAVVDCIVKPFDGSQKGASRTSLPGSAKVGHGGVGRNVAEAIARLGGVPTLVTAVGADDTGEGLFIAMQQCGIRTELVRRVDGGRTATFTALLDGTGELVGAVADMVVFDSVGPADVEKAREAIQRVDLVVCDGNLQASTLEGILVASLSASVPAWYEPVSVAKAGRGACSRPWQLISPNWDELMALLGEPDRPLSAADIEGRVPRVLQEAFARGLSEHVLLTMGPHGVVLGSAASAPPTLPLPAHLVLGPAALLGEAAAADAIPALEVRVELMPSTGGRCLRYRLLRPLAGVRDSTGAGDALVAGAARATAGGWPLEEAVILGLACAHLTLFVDGAVAPTLSAALLDRLSRCIHAPSPSRL